MKRLVPQRAVPKRRAGCSMLVLSVLITCLLLVINRVLAPVVYLTLVPANLELPRLRTILQFLFMVAMLLPEWWAIDFAGRFLSQLRQKAEHE